MVVKYIIHVFFKFILLLTAKLQKGNSRQAKGLKTESLAYTSPR